MGAYVRRSVVISGDGQSLLAALHVVKDVLGVWSGDSDVSNYCSLPISAAPGLRLALRPRLRRDWSNQAPTHQAQRPEEMPRGYGHAGRAHAVPLRLPAPPGLPSAAASGAAARE